MHLALHRNPFAQLGNTGLWPFTLVSWFNHGLIRRSAQSFRRASDAVGDLSANADIRLLPEDEAQAGLLTGLMSTANAGLKTPTAVGSGAVRRHIYVDHNHLLSSSVIRTLFGSAT
jgi:hypothetical protein